MSTDGSDCPQFVPQQHPSALCSLLPQDLAMTGMLRTVVAAHFASAQYIQSPRLKKHLWQAGEATGILIESVHRWKPELTERRPAVLVKRNEVRNQRRGIGDLRQGQPVDLWGHPHYVTFWIGSHTLFCIGGTGAEAELLGTEVQRELTQFGPLILRSLGLMMFRVLSRGAVGILEEAKQNFVVPVTVGYAYEERWVLRQQAPLLRRITLSLLEEC